MRMLKKIGTAVGGLGVSGLALAQTAPTTPAELASSVDFSSVGLALLAVAGSIIGVFVTWKAAKMVIGAVKSA